MVSKYSNMVSNVSNMVSNVSNMVSNVSNMVSNNRDLKILLLLYALSGSGHYRPGGVVHEYM
jgi:hypothetical protein